LFALVPMRVTDFLIKYAFLFCHGDTFFDRYGDMPFFSSLRSLALKGLTNNDSLIACNMPPTSRPEGPILKGTLFPLL
jgi:hypothetical protein